MYYGGPTGAERTDHGKRRRCHARASAPFHGASVARDGEAISARQHNGQDAHHECDHDHRDDRSRRRLTAARGSWGGEHGSSVAQAFLPLQQNDDPHGHDRDEDQQRDAERAEGLSHGPSVARGLFEQSRAPRGRHGSAPRREEPNLGVNLTHPARVHAHPAFLAKLKEISSGLQGEFGGMR
jgi:hypothetical protein